MPELPEVETTVRLLRPGLEGRRIRCAEVHWERSLGGLAAADFERAVAGARIARLWRRAKLVVADLARRGRPAGHLFCHLRMSGRLHLHRPEPDLAAYLRVRLLLDRGALCFVDVRKFGRLWFAADAAAAFARLGPEPLDAGFDGRWLHAALAARRRRLKPLLLDQGFLAGLGNIYVDEALHRAGLHPLARSDRVGRAAAARLAQEIRATLAEAIEREGSSFDRFYRTPAGQPGSYQEQFRVYGRQGRPCATCGATLLRIVVGQRGTHLCPSCQPAPRMRRVRRAVQPG